jgi:hypothetical protein
MFPMTHFLNGRKGKLQTVSFGIDPTVIIFLVVRLIVAMRKFVKKQTTK